MEPCQLGHACATEPLRQMVQELAANGRDSLEERPQQRPMAGAKVKRHLSGSSIPEETACIFDLEGVQTAAPLMAEEASVDEVERLTDHWPLLPVGSPLENAARTLSDLSPASETVSSRSTEDGKQHALSVGDVSTSATGEDEDEGEVARAESTDDIRCFRAMRARTMSDFGISKETNCHSGDSSTSSAGEEEDEDEREVEGSEPGDIEFLRERTFSDFGVCKEWSASASRPSERCRHSSQVLLPSSTYDEDYDPRRPEYLVAVSEEETVVREMDLLQKQISSLQSFLAARVALEPHSPLHEGYRRNIREMELQLRELAHPGSGEDEAPCDLEDQQGLSDCDEWPNEEAQTCGAVWRPRLLEFCWSGVWPAVDTALRSGSREMRPAWSDQSDSELPVPISARQHVQHATRSLFI
mmetsp:Transcript_16872/g.49345  ORF Transcript_16872/g.49345 Transcript_16872/m.49345 type:complete len:414 (+) Transcript_16872:82-1323(+)